MLRLISRISYAPLFLHTLLPPNWRAPMQNRRKTGRIPHAQFHQEHWRHINWPSRAYLSKSKVLHCRNGIAGQAIANRPSLTIAPTRLHVCTLSFSRPQCACRGRGHSNAVCDTPANLIPVKWRDRAKIWHVIRTKCHTCLACLMSIGHADWSECGIARQTMYSPQRSENPPAAQSVIAHLQIHGVVWHGAAITRPKARLERSHGTILLAPNRYHFRIWMENINSASWDFRHVLILCSVFERARARLYPWTWLPIAPMPYQSIK